MRTLCRKRDLDRWRWPAVLRDQSDGSWSFLMHGRVDGSDHVGIHYTTSPRRVNRRLVALRRPADLSLMTSEESTQRLHPNGRTHLASQPAPDLAIANSRRIEAVVGREPTESFPHDSHGPTHGVETSLAPSQLAGKRTQKVLLDLISVPAPRPS